MAFNSCCTLWFAHCGCTSWLPSVAQVIGAIWGNLGQFGAIWGNLLLREVHRDHHHDHRDLRDHHTVDSVIEIITITIIITITNSPRHRHHMIVSIAIAIAITSMRNERSPHHLQDALFDQKLDQVAHSRQLALRHLATQSEVIKATVLEDSPRCGVPSAHKAFMERRAETSYRHESKSVTGGGAVERNRAEHCGHLIIFSYSRSGFGRCVQPGLVRGGRPATVCRSNAPARPRHRPRAETQHSTTSPAAVGSNSWAGKDEVIRAIMLGDSPCLLHGLWEM